MFSNSSIVTGFVSHTVTRHPYGSSGNLSLHGIHCCSGCADCNSLKVTGITLLNLGQLCLSLSYKGQSVHDSCSILSSGCADGKLPMAPSALSNASCHASLYWLYVSLFPGILYLCSWHNASSASIAACLLMQSELFGFSEQFLFRLISQAVHRPSSPRQSSTHLG